MLTNLKKVLKDWLKRRKLTFQLKSSNFLKCSISFNYINEEHQCFDESTSLLKAKEFRIFIAFQINLKIKPSLKFAKILLFSVRIGWTFNE